MDSQKLIRTAKARISFYENLLQNHSGEMYQEDIDRFLTLLSNAYKQLRTLEQESDDIDPKTTESPVNMIAQSTVLDKLIAQIASMNTIEESNAVRQTMQSTKAYVDAQDYEWVRLALSKRLNEIALQGEKELADADALMQR